jgi:aminopyrrolnitrin oxygenase
MLHHAASVARGLPLTGTSAPLPAWPCGWYVVARSGEIPRGSVRAVELAGSASVIFRTASGVLAALDAHCPHMGAHLRHGRVIGEQIRCALHGFLIDCNGNVPSPKGACARAGTWRVAERFGLVFLQLGGRNRGPVPAPERADDYAWTTGRPVALEADWRSMAANSFDMPHLCTIHHRQLVAPIELGTDEQRVFLRYTSQVTGRSLSDRAMKWLSGDRIRVRMSCFGTIILAEANLGSRSTAAVLGMLPTKTGLTAFGAFGIRPGPFLAQRLLVTRLLFTAFLRRDFAIVEGMVLRPDDRDPGLHALFDFLRGLPEHDV